MKTRIKEIRTSLGLTQEKFGAQINVKQATIAAYECGARTPIDAVIGSICKEYGVREEWLRHGTGEMFRNVGRDEEISNFIGEILKDENAEFQRRFVAALTKLNEEEWAVLEKIAKDAAGINEET